MTQMNADGSIGMEGVYNNDLFTGKEINYD